VKICEFYQSTTQNANDLGFVSQRLLTQLAHFMLLFFNEFLFLACPIFLQKHVRIVRLYDSLAQTGS